ncbi:hypothetical protein [Streptomyces wuyuanensis]|uniref:Uncharacterized protein n=1 Tax=Streptomyces wuyuanensis TaxID=1196353 RepID=A0A1H0CTZ5_9ACTN|nr:hypothetical protein [Streptomyces wuyuanensis]SDN61265.1 hypothetical protein SAMN05444921_13120 [Streptomyces wuyuanensis]
MGVTVAVVAAAIVLIGAIVWVSRAFAGTRTAGARKGRAGGGVRAGDAGASTWLVTSGSWAAGGSCDASSSSSSSSCGGGGGGCGGGC